MALDLTKIKGLVFDIYATLVNWEAGISVSLFQLAERLPAPNALRENTAETRKTLVRLYAANEKDVERENPTLAYPLILEEVYSRVAAKLGVTFTREEQVAFGRSIGDWPAFPDTVAAMQVLAKHYKLFVLSNVDDASFARTRAGPLQGAVHWDGIYTAEQIGTYKPNPANYQYAIDHARNDFGIAKDEFVMVAQSLDIDHVACKKMGFPPGVWIERGGAGMGGSREDLEAEGLLDLGAVYPTLGAFAQAVEKAFS